MRYSKQVTSMTMFGSIVEDVENKDEVYGDEVRYKERKRILEFYSAKSITIEA